jgi:hypothetical protein
MENSRKPAGGRQLPPSRKSVSDNPSSRFDPANDGIDHINILFHKAKTKLGHELSHFTKMKFTHPYLGYFTSMEGFWFYVRSGCVADDLRYKYGFDAKQEGRQYESKWNQHFEEDIMAGNYQKIIQNPDLLESFVNSQLPFTHYYLFDTANGGQHKVSARGEAWLSKGFEDLRTALKEQRVPECWINAEQRYVQAHADTPVVVPAETQSSGKPDAF